MPESARPFIAAGVQMRSGRDPASNVDQAAALIREAAAAGASFVQTPEMTNILDRDRERLFRVIAPEQRDPSLASFRELARELGVTLHIGSLAILRADGKAANRAFVVNPEGEIAATYDKIHLFDVDLPNGETWRESRTYTGGDIAVLVDVPGARLGVTICYDVRFPQLYRALAEGGANVLSAPACFTRQTGEAHWQVLQRARAIENGAFMISAAQGGVHEDGRETYGHSIIVDPWGRVLAEAGEEPGLVMATIDPAESVAARGRVPSLRHGKPFTVSLAGRASEAAE
jgi:predicted amidohydrolase